MIGDSDRGGEIKMKQFLITRTRDGASYGEFCDETAEGALDQLIDALVASDRDHEPEGGWTVWELDL